LIDHVHDVLMRIVFKLIKYDETYQPTVQKMADHETINWVHSSTSAEDLRYGRHNCCWHRRTAEIRDLALPGE
jgi:hypothetical protein